MISDTHTGSNSGDLNKAGPGLLILSAANTYHGNTVVNDGIVEIENAQALGVNDGTPSGETTNEIIVNSSLPNNAGSLELFAPLSGTVGTASSGTGGAVGSPIIINTSSTAGMTTGDQVTVSGVTGNTKANGTWVITVINGTSFSLDNTQSAGTFPTDTGAWSDLSAAETSGTAGFTVSNKVIYLNGQGSGTVAGNLVPPDLSVLDNISGNNTWAGPIFLGGTLSGGNTGSIIAGPGGTITIGQQLGTSLTLGGLGTNPSNGQQQPYQEYGQFGGSVLLNGPGAIGALWKEGTGTLILTTPNTYICPTQTVGESSKLRTRTLGTNALNNVIVAGASTLELAVDFLEANSVKDSATGTTNHLEIANTIDLVSPGYLTYGALWSHDGINTVTGTLTSGSREINVDAATQNPLYETISGTPYDYDIQGNTYYGASGISAALDDSLLINQITGSGFTKIGAGQLILPNANGYAGNTTIQTGWVTIGNSLSLGQLTPKTNQNNQPTVTVNSGAALHLLPQQMNEVQTLTLTGGATRPPTTSP